jgi:hypothetical protein
MITQEYLRSIFDYQDGHLVWKVKKAKNTIIGSRAGRLDAEGYIIVGIDGREEKAHRLIFIMHNGYCPAKIDHIDRNTSNNRIENLREATSSENMMNKKVRRTSKSGVTGVHYCNRQERWIAKITINQKTINLGSFLELYLAKQARKAAEMKYFGKFAPMC